MGSPLTVSEISIEGTQMHVRSGWHRALFTLSDILDRISKACFVFSTAVFAAIMLVGVFFRYILNDSLPWSDELAMIVFVWSILLAIASGFLNGSHVNFDMLLNRLPENLAAKAQIVAEGLTCGYLLSLMVSSMEALEMMRQFRTDALQLSFMWPYLSIPVASAVMSVHWARLNMVVGSPITKLVKLSIGTGFFFLVYLHFGQYLQVAGGLRALLIAVTLFGPMLIGVPVAICMGLTATVYVGLIGKIPFQTGAMQIFFGINVLTLMAIPLLILSGKIMHTSGMAKLIVDFAQVLVGRLRGGLGASNVVASFIFGDISGSAVADTAAIGSLMIPQMRARGYHADFCAALQGAAGSLGMMAPLSITLLLYSTAVNASVSRLAAATILPAFMVAFSFILITMWHARRHNYPKEYISREDYAPRTLRALPGIFGLVIVVGGVMGGVCTPAEVGTVLLTYTLLLSFFLYRTAKPKLLYDAFVEGGHIAGMTLFMVATSSFIGFMLARDLVSIRIMEVMSTVSTNRLIIVFMISMLFVILGMILEPPAMIFGFLPCLLPLMAHSHVDLVYFGVLFCVNMGLGCILPPVALNLFVSTKLAGVNYEQAVRATVPFMIIMVIDIVVLAVFHQIPLLLPHLLFGYPIP